MDASFCYIGLKIQLAALQNSDSDDPKTISLPELEYSFLPEVPQPVFSQQLLIYLEIFFGWPFICFSFFPFILIFSNLCVSHSY